MSSYAEVIILTEGRTEQIFIKQLLAPYMSMRGAHLTPVQLDKPGQKGGGVRFARAKNDIARHLKQRKNTYVSLMVDYYGIGTDWPGLDDIPSNAGPDGIASIVYAATQAAIDTELADHRSNARFVPHISIHEFEALLFSEPHTLADALQVDRKHIDKIIRECGEPEAINNSRHSAPSSRISRLHERFKKTSTGIAIAKLIGIEQMRSMCPIFNNWLCRLESLAAGA